MKRVWILVIVSLSMLAPALVTNAAPRLEAGRQPAVAQHDGNGGQHRARNRGQTKRNLQTTSKERNSRQITKKGSAKPLCFDKKQTLAVTGIDLVQGSTGADIIVGDEADNKVEGRGGVDRICLGPGNDFVTGSFSGNVQDPMFVAGGVGDDFLSGENGDDRIVGKDGIDSITGFGGDDVLAGGKGVDDLIGLDGDDELSGGKGNDRLSGQGGRDDYFGGSGDDLIFGMPEPGNPEPDGVDHVFGGDGNDTIRTDDGTRDTVDCGPGQDTVTFDPGLDDVQNCEIENPAA